MTEKELIEELKQHDISRIARVVAAAIEDDVKEYADYTNYTEVFDGGTFAPEYMLLYAAAKSISL